MKINLHNMRKCLFNTFDLRSYRKSEVWKLFKKNGKSFASLLWHYLKRGRLQKS